MTNTQTTTDTRSLDEALEGLRFAMVGTHDGREWRSRPLSLAEQEGDLLRFLVPVTADWVEALEARGSRAAVTFSDPHKNTYVALQGDARTVADRALVERLWNPGAAAFFDGPDDPTVRVLEVRVTDGEYWDGPSGRVGQMLSLVKAAMGGDAGSKGDVAT
jgi:general stress protein 26